MGEKQIKELLKSFNYDRNSIDDTLEFLLLICYNITKIKEVKPVKFELKTKKEGHNE